MGVLGNIYCIPHSANSVPWATILSTLVERALVRPPYRSGSPFRTPSDRSRVLWPENWIVPETLRPCSATPPPHDHPDLAGALAYVQNFADATITMDSPCAAFQTYPDQRDFSAALALYRFREKVQFRIGVPDDVNQLIQPRWQGMVTELLWLHGKCVPSEDEFVGSPLHEVLRSTWPSHLLLADVFL